MLIVDTLSAYFFGKDENDNSEAQNFMIWLRGISDRIPGNPAILVCCHPYKGAKGEDLIPRGASAFFNSFDGLLTLEKQGDFCRLAKHPLKYRGPDFAPMYFERETVRPAILKGVSTVVARYVEGDEAEEEIEKSHNDALEVLKLIVDREHMRNATQEQIADSLMWLLPKGGANQRRVSRAIKVLRDKKLATGGLGKRGKRTPLEPTEERLNLFKNHTLEAL